MIIPYVLITLLDHFACVVYPNNSVQEQVLAAYLPQPD